MRGVQGVQCQGEGTGEGRAQEALPKEGVVTHRKVAREDHTKGPMKDNLLGVHRRKAEAQDKHQQGGLHGLGVMTSQGEGGNP